MSVLITGAGPSGLTLAIELAKQGIDFRIIDEKTEITSYSKALALQPRTLELFETMGLLEQFLEKGKKISKITCHRNQKELPLFLDNSSRFPYLLILPQSETERILLGELKKWKEVEFGHKLIGNHTIIKNDHSFEKAHYDFLIAADGIHSTIRELHHIPFIGTTFPETFFLADLIVNTNLSQNEIHLFLQDSPLLLIPLTLLNHFRIITIVEFSSSDAKSLIEKKCKNLPFSFAIESIQNHSFFSIQRRVAKQFHKNKLFLLGDAAHVHSPIGGQGLNTSIQDALNLSWKLSYCIKKKSPHFLVRSYEKERQPIAKELIKWTTNFTKLLNFATRFPFLLFLVIKMIGNTKKFRNTLLGLSTHYKNSPLTIKSKLQGIQPGDRVPNCFISETNLYTLLQKKKFVLLISTNKPKFLKPFIFEELICHPLHEQPFLHQNRIGPKEYLLIRPDGYLAMRGRFSEQKKLENYLNKLFFPSLRR